MNKICKDTFWEMIAQGRAACAGDLEALVQWLEDKLAEMGPEAALKDPDSLAELSVCKKCWFPDIAYVGDAVYHRITGKDNGGYPDRETFDALKEELKKDITYGDGVGYPHTWSEIAVYLPRLCAKYMQPGELEWRIANHNDTWNPTSEEIQIARATEKKGVTSYKKSSPKKEKFC